MALPWTALSRSSKPISRNHERKRTGMKWRSVHFCALPRLHTEALLQEETPSFPLLDTPDEEVSVSCIQQTPVPERPYPVGRGRLEREAEAEAAELEQSQSDDVQALKPEYQDVIISDVRTDYGLRFSVQILNTEGTLIHLSFYRTTSV